MALNVTLTAEGMPVSCRLDGDFFVEGDTATASALLSAIGEALVAGKPIQPVLDSRPDALLIGTDASAIQAAYARALASSLAPVLSDGASGGNGSIPPDPARTGAAAVGRSGAGQRSEAVAPFPQYRDRWARLGRDLQVVMDTPRSAAEQMTLDETWARQVADGERPATLRFWQWAEPAVVVGRFQSIPDEVNEAVARAEGFAVVRRVSGGGAMFVRPEHTITYSLYAPLWFVQGMTVAESYQLCDSWLIGALRGMGVDACFSGLNDIACSHGKIGGAAQRRFPSRVAQGPGAVLHHVTLAWDLDADLMVRVLNVNPVKADDKAVRSARRRVYPLCRHVGGNRADVLQSLAKAAIEWSAGSHGCANDR